MEWKSGGEMHIKKTRKDISKLKPLIRQGYDYAPLHFCCNANIEKEEKSFRFLNSWAKHYNFKEMVEINENMEIQGNPF